jgi:FMN phosphatase YigB (HAD superfamily)
MLEKVNLEAPQCMFVGDNLFDDIQGAKRMGMKAILSKEYAHYESLKVKEGDLQPDAVINSLDELEGLLLG